MRKRNPIIIFSLIMGLIVHQCPMSYGILALAWGIFEKFNTLEDVYLKRTTPSTADLLDVATEQSRKLDEIGDTLAKMGETLDLLLNRLPLLGRIDGDVKDLNAAIGRIDTLYGRFESYIRNPGIYDQKMVGNLIEAFTDVTGDSVMGTIDRMYALIVPERLENFKKSLFYNLAKAALHENLKLCGTGGSPQKRLVELFNIIVETEVRGALMTAFGWTMRAYMENTSVSVNLKTAEKELQKRGDRYLKVLKDALKIAPTQFRQCDPPKGHKIGVTALEFQKFLQGYIIAEKGVFGGRRCDDSCESHSFPTNVHWTECDGFGCDSGPRLCRGDLLTCESSSKLDICQDEDWKDRRYTWLRDDEGNKYGDVGQGCRTGEMVYAAPTPMMAETKGRTTVAIPACALCKCICAEWQAGSTSTRFISTRERLADVNDNMVIIGLSFIIKDRVAHIGVMQGELGPKGFIDEDTISWIEPENIQVRQDGWRFKFWKVTEGKNDEEMRWNTDVSPMDPDYRRLSLDRLTLPENYVLTGVKFGRFINGRNDPIQLEIQGTRFDYDTGKLTSEDSMWIQPEHNDKGEIYAMEDAVFGNPTRVKSSEIDTEPGTYIDMYWSDWADDAAQTTLPLLDAVPVHGLPHMPLIGVGLYHKREEGYGGFLTFVLDEINRASYLTTYEAIQA